MKIGIILLAAGLGSRFGGNKLEARIDGKPMYQIALEKVAELEEQKIKIIVTGNQNIGRMAEKMGILAVYNQEPELGISHSIELGLNEVQKAGVQAAMFMVCDQPWLKESTLRAMVCAYRGGILQLKWGKTRGNPVIFEKDCFEELKALTGDTGGRKILSRYKNKICFFEASELVELKDIDTRENLTKEGE